MFLKTARDMRFCALVYVWLVPDPLKLIVIDEEMDPAMLDRLFAGHVIEAHQRVGGG